MIKYSKNWLYKFIVWVKHCVEDAPKTIMTNGYELIIIISSQLGVPLDPILKFTICTGCNPFFFEIFLSTYYNIGIVIGGHTFFVQ